MSAKMKLWNGVLYGSLLLFQIPDAGAEGKTDFPRTTIASPANLKVVTLLPWQNSTNVKRIAPDNPDRIVVEARIQTLISRYKLPYYDRPEISEPVQLETPALRRLFPGYRFYLIGWNEVAAKPRVRDAMVSAALGLYITLVVPAQGATTEVSGFGNYQEFGNLLSGQKVRLRTLEDASLVWTAFCDIHQKQWIDQRLHRRISNTEWALGENVRNDVRYWYRVAVDAEGVVLSAKLLSEKIPPRPANTERGAE